MKNLWDLKEQTKAKIKSIENVSEVSDRLSQLGFKPGSEVTCVKKLPFNGPRAYQVSDSVFSLDKETANKIKISEG